MKIKNLREERGKKLFWTQLLSIATIILAIATIGVAIFTWLLVDSQNKLVNSQNKLVKTQNDLLERETLLEGPYLSIWQSGSYHNYSNTRFITEEGRKDWVYTDICFRNEGKTSTGPISIYYNADTNFYVNVLSSYFGNIPSHEGNCTTLGIYYCSTSVDSSCKKEIVPLGNITIPIHFYCTLCQKTYYTNISFCIFNETEDECK
ncbi:MAG: hypothetical protein HYW26_01730 [Candidatus Aenigmarchaeota archaeon]|nr:hypothetical protein [Candidatus Aenigmarchaeota archaeon]